MKIILFMFCWLVAGNSIAQNNITANIIEGGKTVVELVRVIKTPRNTMGQQPLVEKKDSCSIKNISDMCIKNITANPLLVSLYRRNGAGYETAALSVKVLPQQQEFLFELRAGIYKMKIEMETGEVKKLFREGEIKISACSNIFKEIKND